MSLFVDVDYASINKYKEELCGDKVEIIRNENSVIIVLADGLGSGVKANILSTLTSKIIGTMLSMGSTIEEAVETIASTLPVCKVRDLAYSTFSILQIYENGEAYLVEFDNPSAIRLKKGRHVVIDKEEREIEGKLIKESRFLMSPDDVIILITDGAIHAGVGEFLNLGWQWENVKEYAERIYKKDMSVKNISNTLLSACDSLYAGKAGDDTTVVAVKLRNAQPVNVLIGPPSDKNMDSYVVDRFISQQGKKVICGGTTAQIVSKVTGKEIATSFNYIDPSIPPTAKIEGIDLTTEGVLTMYKALEYAKKYLSSENVIQDFSDINKEDGASKLAKLLLEDSTEVSFLVGRAINPAHQNPDFPLNLGMKLKLVNDMENCLKQLGKKVFVEYF
ncbi:stage II sporulation protein E [Clostridiales bacterium oral taxon 876 str. F0540]|nr:stage II sporulation protein E [Clostridiales bacterium oral taxon 876 str. F0540]